MIEQITAALMPLLTTALTAIGAFALAATTRWIQAHAKNAQVEGILDRLRDTVATVVAETEQTFVKQLGEGGLSKENAAKALDAALASLKTHLGPKGIKELETIFPPSELEKILISFIEAQVHMSKAVPS